VKLLVKVLLTFGLSSGIALLATGIGNAINFSSWSPPANLGPGINTVSFEG
jgi:hypothetical protein